MISAESLKEFKRIWKKEYNEDISDQVAMEAAVRLLNLFKAVYGGQRETLSASSVLQRYDRTRNAESIKNQ